MAFTRPAVPATLPTYSQMCLLAWLPVAVVVPTVSGLWARVLYMTNPRLCTLPAEECSPPMWVDAGVYVFDALLTMIIFVAAVRWIGSRRPIEGLRARNVTVAAAVSALLVQFVPHIEYLGHGLLILAYASALLPGYLGILALYCSIGALAAAATLFLLDRRTARLPGSAGAPR